MSIREEPEDVMEAKLVERAVKLKKKAMYGDPNRAKCSKSRQVKGDVIWRWDESGSRWIHAGRARVA
jgi:hypothetical protein